MNQGILKIKVEINKLEQKKMQIEQILQDLVIQGVGEGGGFSWGGGEGRGEKAYNCN